MLIGEGVAVGVGGELGVRAEEGRERFHNLGGVQIADGENLGDHFVPGGDFIGVASRLNRQGVLGRLGAFNDFKNPEELPVGSIIVIKLVNPFEPSCPLFDNIQGTYETLWYAASRLPELVAPELLKQSREYQKMNQGLTATLINHLLYILVSKKVLHIKPEYLPLIGEAVIAAEALIRKFSRKKKRAPRYLNHLRILSEATQSSILSQAERILAYPKRAHLLGRAPKKLNVLLFGHTHQPLTLRTESGVYANCGCWRPRAIALYRKVFRLRQTLNFVVVSKTRQGKVRVRLLDFLKTLEREASPENT